MGYAPPPPPPPPPAPAAADFETTAKRFVMFRCEMQSESFIHSPTTQHMMCLSSLRCLLLHPHHTCSCSAKGVMEEVKGLSGAIAAKVSHSSLLSFLFFLLF